MPDAARDQLRALVADRGFTWPGPLADRVPTQGSQPAQGSLLVQGAVATGAPSETPVNDARPAAVLILFGVLDDVPARAGTWFAAAHNAGGLARSGGPGAPPAVGAGLDVLLLARATTLRHHPGQVSFPGGRIDPGDADATAAALREARDETGLDTSGVDVLGTLPSAPLVVSRHVVTPVIGWWSHPTPVRAVDQGETALVFRAPVADLIDPANRCRAVVHRDIRQHSSPAFWIRDGAAHKGAVHDQVVRSDAVRRETANYLVWGFTGLVLDTLFDRLGWSVPWDQTRTVDLTGGPGTFVAPPKM